MALEKLDNLVKLNKLKLEQPDENEFDGMLASAKRQIQDAQLQLLPETTIDIVKSNYENHHNKKSGTFYRKISISPYEYPFFSLLYKDI